MFECYFENCMKSYTNKSHLNRHLKTHSAIRCKAKFCKIVFNSKEEMENHYLMEHKANQPETFYCDKCDIYFKSSAGLFHHKKIHDPYYRFL